MVEVGVLFEPPVRVVPALRDQFFQELVVEEEVAEKFAVGGAVPAEELVQHLVCQRMGVQASFDSRVQSPGRLRRAGVLRYRQVGGVDGAPLVPTNIDGRCPSRSSAGIRIDSAPAS